MNGPVLQLLVLAAIAVFLIVKLRGVLGTREGFEKPPLPSEPAAKSPRNFEVIEGGPDHDITDHVPEDSPSAAALARMKRAEPGFGVTSFLGGARGAYEMILMGFENGQIKDLQQFMSPEVYASFDAVIQDRAEKGQRIDATFVGISSMDLVEASYDEATGEGDVTVRFVAELTSVLRDAGGEILEGDPNAIQKQRDTWTFSRVMGASDPNWQLVATGE